MDQVLTPGIFSYIKNAILSWEQVQHERSPKKPFIAQGFGRFAITFVNYFHALV